MTDAAHRRLLDRLRPDTARTGRVRRLLATTHNLEAEFFDTDFLCTALSIAQTDFVAHSGQLALQRKLAGLDYSGVLCEARAYEARPSLRTVVHPVLVPGACLHAKLLIIEYEHAVRVLLGSANLTAAGYRHNREVCGESIAHEDESEKAAQLAAILRSAREVLTPFSARAQEFLGQLDRVLARVEGWASGQPVAVSSVLWSDGARPLWRALLERWPAGLQVQRLRVVSPFWCEDGSSDTPLRRLLAELRRRNTLAERCAVQLFVESAPLAEGGFAPKLHPAVYFADFPGVSVRVIPVDPRVDSAELDVKVELNAARSLHAKLLVLESRDRALAYAGSANFTRNGFALRHAASGSDQTTANVEAGWAFELPAGEVGALLPPSANAGQELVSLAAPLQPDSAPIEEPPTFWPGALLCAELTPAPGDQALDLSTTWDAATPAGWTVRAPAHAGMEPESGQLLLTTTAGNALVTTALSAAALEAILRQRHVLVESPGGSAAFPVNVAVGAARDRLPLSAAGAKPGESDLLLYYQGRITFEDLYPDLDAASGPAHAGATKLGTSVDKSRIQAYQIRAFVDALPGMQRELLSARGSRGMIYQAFLGEVSPLALARHVVAQVEAGTRSSTAGAFQLVELIELLRAVAAEAPADVEHYAELCQQAQAEMEAALAHVRGRHPNTLHPTSAFAHYAEQLQEMPR